MTVLGEFVLPHGGHVWTSTLVEAMATVGIAEKNARQAVARLADQGLLTSERAGRRVRWRLSATGHELLTTGTDRIFGFMGSEHRWSGQWLIITFSVPEEQRSSRHHLRQRLSFAGFGFPGSGVAVSTHLEREDLAIDALRDLGVDDKAMVFCGSAGKLAGDADLVGRAWELDALAGQYRSFVGRFAALDPGDAPATVAALTHLVHAWRRFPSVDPELPAELLPQQWPGREAKALFDACHAGWVGVARRWFDDRDATPT